MYYWSAGKFTSDWLNKSLQLFFLTGYIQFSIQFKRPQRFETLKHIMFHIFPKRLSNKIFTPNTNITEKSSWKLRRCHANLLKLCLFKVNFFTKWTFQWQKYSSSRTFWGLKQFSPTLSDHSFSAYAWHALHFIYLSWLHCGH